MGILDSLFGADARNHERQRISELFLEVEKRLRDQDTAGAEALLEQIVQIIEQRSFRNAHYDIALVHSRIAKIAQSLGKQPDSKHLSDVAFSEVWKHPKPNNDAFRMAALTVATDFVEMGQKDRQLGWEVLALLRFDRAARLYTLALGPDHPNVRTAIEEIDTLYRSAVDALASGATRAQRVQGARSLRRLLTERVPKRSHSLHAAVERTLLNAVGDQDRQIRDEVERALALFQSASE